MVISSCISHHLALLSVQFTRELLRREMCILTGRLCCIHSSSEEHMHSCNRRIFSFIAFSSIQPHTLYFATLPPVLKYGSAAFFSYHITVNGGGTSLSVIIDSRVPSSSRIREIQCRVKGRLGFIQRDPSTKETHFSYTVIVLYGCKRGILG